MTPPRFPATRRLDPHGVSPGAFAGHPSRTTRARVERAALAILVRLLARVAALVAVLAVGGALFSRVRGGVVTEPMAVADGVVGEKGSGAWLYAVRTRGGLALVDAGRDSKGRPIDAALAALGARRSEVTDVLITHGHPSETMGLAAVRGARVHAGAGDVELITGRERPGRGLDRIVGLVLPHATAHVEDAIGTETVLDVGGERVLAFPVPGHSRGSTAYLIRGVLFVGDAGSIHDGRLVPGPRFMSDDPKHAEHALVRLARRFAGEPVSRICSAHAGCSDPGSAPSLLREAAGP